MTLFIRSAEMHLFNEDLVRERIRSLRREAAEERLARRVRSVRKARRRMERASERLNRALARL
jgi:hypothetical protein